MFCNYQLMFDILPNQFHKMYQENFDFARKLNKELERDSKIRDLVI